MPIERQNDQFGIFDHDRSARDRRASCTAAPREAAEYLRGVGIPAGLLNTRRTARESHGEEDWPLKRDFQEQ